MKKSKLIVLIMVVFSLSLGGCSFFNGQSTKKQEMIQIAESKKMKVAIENMLKDIDPEALTPQGKIHSYKILENQLEYNDTTVHIEDSGEFEAGSYGISAELSRLLRGDEYGK